MKLKELWNHWKRIAKVIGDFQSRLILTIFYFLILGPVALCYRLFADPLHLETPARVTWSSVKILTEKKLDAARRQF